MYRIYKITVAPGVSYDCIGDCALELKVGDHVIVKCDRYQEYASILEIRPMGPFNDIHEYEELRSRQKLGRHIEGQKIPQVLRLATEIDAAKAEENEGRAKDAYMRTIDCIRNHGLEMKLILSHYAFDRKMLMFQFSAEGRIDFRNLLRDLSAMFHVRVELRQVGVRDEASILGGIGTCGRRLCCASFLTTMTSVNVKMAKQQGLSLNPQSISGCCGRLKCCLQFESDEYEKALKKKKEEEAAANAPPTKPLVPKSPIPGVIPPKPPPRPKGPKPKPSRKGEGARKGSHPRRNGPRKGRVPPPRLPRGQRIVQPESVAEHPQDVNVQQAMGERRPESSAPVTTGAFFQ